MDLIRNLNENDVFIFAFKEERIVNKREKIIEFTCIKRDNNKINMDEIFNICNHLMEMGIESMQISISGKPIVNENADASPMIIKEYWTYEESVYFDQKFLDKFKYQKEFYQITIGLLLFEQLKFEPIKRKIKTCILL